MILKFVTYLSIFTIIFTGCATKGSVAGQQTREINNDLKNDCIFVTNQQVSSAVKFGPMANKETVENEIKNKTAAYGGNAYFINNFIETSFGHYSSSFEIYKCPETKYAMSKQYKALKELKELFEVNVITKDDYEREKSKILNSYQK